MPYLPLILVFLLFSCPTAPLAAFKSTSDTVKPEEAFNPKPDKKDILLPMPCGLSLALRGISVPQGALIRDKTFAMGISNSQDSERQIYERQFPGYIAAPFTQRDLPRSWIPKLSSSRKSTDSWYFIGKYEISRLQWAAVMDTLDANGEENREACPRNITAEFRLPITGISWFEAQEFLNKYNAWLVKNHITSLPAFSGTQNIAFLRMPTEEEWEFAARGGAHVPPEWWSDQDIFPFEDGKTINDYAVISQDTPLPGPLPIGSRYPNPAGIHDTSGNAREMVDGFFRMSIPDIRNGQVIRRLHGAAGGILTKGGSYASTRNEFLPGWRDEIPLYTANGPGRPHDLGLRVVLSGLNVPNAQRLKELRTEAGKAKFTPQNPEDLGETPIEAIDALASRADETLKANLQKVRELIESQMQAQEAEDQKTLEQSIRSLLYQAETLRAFAYKYLAAQEQLEKVRQMLRASLSSEQRTQAKKVLADGETDLNDYMQTLKMGANYYKLNLESLLEKTPRDIDGLLAQFGKEYGSTSIFDNHMRKNLATLQEFMTKGKKSGIQSLGTREILAKVLPANHFKRLKI